MNLEVRDSRTGEVLFKRVISFNISVKEGEEITIDSEGYKVIESYIAIDTYMEEVYLTIKVDKIKIHP